MNLDIIENGRKLFKKSMGSILSMPAMSYTHGRPLPRSAVCYIQLENGVGMIRLMTSEVEEVLKTADDDGKEKSCRWRPAFLLSLY